MPAGKMAVFTIFPAVLLKNQLETLVVSVVCLKETLGTGFALYRAAARS